MAVPLSSSQPGGSSAGTSKRAIKRQRKKDNRRLVTHPTQHSITVYAHCPASYVAIIPSTLTLTHSRSLSSAACSAQLRSLAATDNADSQYSDESESALQQLPPPSHPPPAFADDDTFDSDVDGSESDTALVALQQVMQRFNARLSSKDEMLQQQQQQSEGGQTAATRWDADDDESVTAGTAGGEVEDDYRSAAHSASDTHLTSLSRRQQRVVSRLSLSELKALTDTPALVELHDTNSPDPRLLVAMKAANNAVAVPPHWQAKRKYLANKRGYEKPPFALPAFLADTGISAMRGVQLSKEADKTGKQKQRESMRPKMGAIDIDYNTLHDAFFRYQTKPPLTTHGDCYYEGKEFESGMQSAAPLQYSAQLMEAVGMAAVDSPPPWLSAMQRYGPPPAYPFLRVAGVNGPLPAGGRWGVGEGEWGKPPVDDTGRPLWGGELFGEAKHNSRERKIHQQHWGHVHTATHEDGDEEADDDRHAPHTEADDDTATDSVLDGSSSSGVASVVPPTGLSTPAAINLRKQADGAGTETPNTVHPTSQSQQLFTVLDEQPVERGVGVLLPATHTYHISSVEEPAGADSGTAERERRRKAGGVDVTLDPAELDTLDAQTLKRKYEQQQRQQQQQRVQQTSAGEEDDEHGTSSISKEVDETARKKRKKDSQQQKFKF